MRPIRYPVRCIIVDVEGMPLSDGGDFVAIAKTPNESKPHIGVLFELLY